MHLDDLEHSQIILLSILLTVIISVATSVSVLSILESRQGEATVVSKTINRIIERKISTDKTSSKEITENDVENILVSIIGKDVQKNNGENIVQEFSSSQIQTTNFDNPVILLKDSKTLLVEKNYINQSGDLDIKFKENTYTFSEIKDSRFQNYSLYRLGELNSKLPIKSIIKIGKEVDIKIAKKVFLLNSGNKNLFYTEGVISTINKNKNKNKILNFTVSADKGNNYKNLFVFDTEGYLLGIWFKNDSKDITPIYDIISLYNSNK